MIPRTFKSHNHTIFPISSNRVLVSTFLPHTRIIHRPHHAHAAHVTPTVSPRPSRRRRHAVRRSRPPRLRPQRPLSDTRTPLEGTHCARERWGGRWNWDFPYSFSFFYLLFFFISLPSFLYVQYLLCDVYLDEYKRYNVKEKLFDY